MKRSPGHRRWPDHKVREEHLDQRIRAKVNGEVVAASDDVIKVVEDENPERYYFPREDVEMEDLEASERTTECPFKGRGRYYDVSAGGRRIGDAAWSYEDPYEEHRDLKDRVAFHATEMQAVEVVPRA